MTLDLNSGDYKVFRDAFRKFLETEIIPHYESWEKECLVPREAWKKCGKMGFLCPWVDDQYGGSNADFGYSVIMGEELALAGCHILFGLHSDIVVPYIDSFGNKEQKQRWLPGCVSGDIISAVAMTEPDAGSDLASIKTTAIKDGDHYIINGSKTFISSGYHCDIAVVACRTDPQATPPHKGISLIVVENGTPGFIKGRKLDKMGFRSQDTAELFFEDCRVPVANLLGEEGRGFFYLMDKLQQERLVNAVLAQALAEKILKQTISYCQSRIVFGKPVSRHQHNSFKIVEMATELELGRSFLNRLIEDHMQGKGVVKEVSMAKYWLTEMVNRVAAQCLQLHGGYGVVEEYPICRDYRDARVLTIWAGSTEVMKTIIARELGL